MGAPIRCFQGNMDGQPVMPSKTLKQHGFMAICAHAAGKAQKKCPPKEVAKEYLAADKTFKKGK